MSITEFRTRAAKDTAIRDAVARSVAPALLELIESGQRLNNPDGINRRSMDDSEVFELVRIISDYRHLMHIENEGDEYDRANAAIACGHGYTLMDSCPSCDNYEPTDAHHLPLIALHRLPEED